MRRAIVVCGSMFLLVAGCATIASHGKNDIRDETLARYAATLRFGDFTTAYQFVDPKVRAEHPLDTDAKRRYNSVEVGAYLTDGPTETGENTVSQIAQISLVVKSSQTAYDIVDHETWQYDPVAKQWWLESGLPDITPPQQ